MKMTKAVVTGGAGFIGSHLVDALCREGVSVLIIDDFSSGSRANLSGAKSKSGDRPSVIELDICNRDIEKIFKQFSPEVVFHLAAQMNVRKSVEDPAFDCDKNVEGTVNLLEATKRCHCAQFVFASTGGAIYGEQDVFPAPENHVIRPESPYGVSKRAAELYLEYYSRAYKMSCVSLRFANVYGPRQNPKGEAGVVAIFTERMYKGEPLRINGDGKQTRDFVYVGDVVSANLLASKEVRRGEYQIYNVGTGKESSVLDIAAVMGDIHRDNAVLQEKGKFNIAHGPALAGEQRRSVIDSTKLSKTLGWRVTVDLRDGLRETVNWFGARSAI